jgi:hypothetical protein
LEKRSLVGTFATDVEAELARAKLEAEGIGSIVVEPASVNPLQLHAAAGARVEVPEKHATRARAILAALAVMPDELSDEERVRCPKCELEYCDPQRPSIKWFVTQKMTGLAGLFVVAFGGVFVFAALWVLKLGRLRWTCDKCGHRWDDPNEGPRQPTRPEPDDPTPVFRLRRNSAGMGCFLGFLAAPIGMGLLEGGWWWFVIGPVIGGAIGKAITRDVCSEPKCRTALPRDAGECPRCRGVVGRVIERAGDHYAEAAAARRAIAADRKTARPKQKPKLAQSAAS